MPALQPFVPKVVRWPGMPLRPEPGEPIVIRAQINGPRSDMRRGAREIICTILPAWSFPEARLIETPTGPFIFNPGGETIGASLAYAENTAWIALRIGGDVGLDAMVPSDFPGLSQVALRYLGPVEAEHLATAPDRARAFAVAWTRHESRLKLVRGELTEYANETGVSTAHTHTLRMGAYLVSVAY